MKKYLIKIFSVLLACWMVVITGGLHVYANDCSCCYTQEVSMLDIDSCCIDDDKIEACEADEKFNDISCCPDPGFIGININTEDCKTDNCCTVSHKYYKLADSFQNSENILLKSVSLYTSLMQELNEDACIENDFHKLIFTHNTSPPGFTGKAFLIFTHTLKIPLT